MNRTRYRIVFNRQRGQLMAVAETAAAHGKAQGEHSSPSADRAPALPGLIARYAHPLSILSLLSPVAMAAALSFAAAHPARAQIIADPSAPAGQRPTVLVDGTGRPLVNIQTPSAAGVSRNTYTQFDVQAKGAVLNNARAANPWLATGEAKVILNEVNSSKSSYLGGAITVNGSRAQVVIANPSGIQVDGASFVNASRATLTTGTPVLTNGALTGLDVRQGTVSVTAKGLNVKGVSYTDILSRAATLAGRIDGNATDELAITTGPQRVDYATGQITVSPATSGTGTAPTVAIDTAALGGMYAGKITLLANEAGTGVRNAGTLQTTGGSGQLIVTADGRLENIGQISAAVTSVATVNGHIDHSGVLRGDQLLMVSAGNDLNLSGAGLSQTSPSTVVLSARRDVNLAANAKVASVMSTTTDGVLTASGRIAVSAGRDVRLASGSSLKARDEVAISADGRLEAISATVSSSTARVTALAAQGMALTGSTVKGPRVHLETGAPFVASQADISLKGSQLLGTQQNTVIATGSLGINGTGSQDVTSGGNAHLQAGKDLTFTAGTTASGAHLTAIAGGALLLQGAAGSTATNGSRVSLRATGDLSLAGDSVTLQGSQITAGGALSIEAAQATQAGQTAVAMTTLAHANGTAYERTQLNAGQDLNISAYQGSISVESLVATGQNVRVISNGFTHISHVYQRSSTGGLQVLGSTLTAREDLTVGSVAQGQSVALQAADLKAAGKLTLNSSGPVALLSSVDFAAQASGGLSAAVTRLQLSGTHVTVQGSSLLLQGAKLNATGGHLSLSAIGGTLTASNGTVHFGPASDGSATELAATGNLAVQATGALTAGKAIATAGGSAAFTSATAGITASDARLTAGDMLSLSSKGAQTHTGNTYQGGALSVYNEGGTLTLNNTSLKTDATQSAATQALSGQLSIESGGAFFADAATRFDAATDLSLVAGAGNINLTPNATDGLRLSYEQVGGNRKGRDLTIIARNGDLTLDQQYGYFSNARDMTLAGNHVSLKQGGLSATRKLNIVALTGDVTISGTNELSDLGTGSWNRYVTNTKLSSSGADGAIDIRAARDINLTAASIDSKGTTSLSSGGNINVGGLLNETYEAVFWPFEQTSVVYGSELYGTKGLSISALGGSLTMLSGSLHAKEGTLRLQALDDINLQATQYHYLSNTSRSSVDRNWYGGKKVTTTSVHTESLATWPVWTETRDIDIKAGRNVNTYATEFNATNGIRIEAGEQANYYGVYDQIYNNTTTNKTKSFLGITYDKSKATATRSELVGRPAVLISQGTIQSVSGGDQLLQGTVVQSPTVPVFAIKSAAARPDAVIRLEALKNTVTESRTRESNYVVWQKQSGQGSTVETLVLPKFIGPAAPIFNGPVVAQLPAGDFKTQVQALSTQPGMAYLADLAKRPDVNWQPVKLAHEQWSYKQDGLTPAGAALLSVAVAVATQGMGAELLGTTTSVTSAAANAAFTSLSAQAAITLVNNKGDIGKTLKALARSDTVKATLAAAITAGVLDKIGAIPDIKALGKTTSLTDKLTFNLINAGGRALTNTAIMGGNLEEALKGAILGGVVDTLHGAVASEIKVLESEYIAHKLAHALVGCVAGAAAQGSCQDGAIGAAVGEMVARLMPPDNQIAYSDAEKARVLAYSKIIAGAVSAYSGGNAQTAITTAETAVQNNALLPLLIGAVWLADKAWTAYEVSQDIAAIRDGNKSVEQLALEKGEEYVTGIVLGNIARYGFKAVKVGGKWIQSRDDTFSHIMESRSNSYTPNSGSVGNMKAFLDSPGFGSQLKESSQKTNKIFQGQAVYKATDQINTNIKAGDQFYLDGLHKNHIEVFDQNNKFKVVLNLDGSLNQAKTTAAQSQGRTLPKF